MRKKINLTISVVGTFMLLAFVTVTASGIKNGKLPHRRSQTAVSVAEGGGLPPMKKPLQFTVAEGGGLPPMKKPLQNPQVLA